MTGLSRRKLITTASGVGAATMLAAAMSASANPLGMQQGHFKQEPVRPSGDTARNQPMNVDLLKHVRQKLVPPPFVPAHDQEAIGAPKVVQVRLVIEEKAMEIDDDGTEVQAMTFNGSVPGPLIVVHQGDYVELTLE